jgi:hypothetical protein
MSTAISGAISGTYQPAAADVGQPLSVVVTATNSAGTVSQTSAKTAAIAGYTLAYPPPTLSSPTTVTLSASTSVNTQATGSSSLGLDNTKDYIIVMPVTRTSTVQINGGRNIVILGGHISLSAQTDAAILITDNSTNGASAPQQGRTVHIEGVAIDNPNTLAFDGIDYNCPTAIIQVQNCRITGLSGSVETTHADITQNQGGAQEVRWDHCTGAGNYQGIFWQPGNLGGGTTDILKAEVSNVNLYYDSPAVDGTSTITYLLWVMGPGNTGTTTLPYSFTNVYVANSRSGQTAQANSLWPGTTNPSGYHATYNSSTGAVTFPGTNLTGQINVGTPPGGDYCASGVAGIGYSSPGYGNPASSSALKLSAVNVSQKDYAPYAVTAGAPPG